MLETIRRKSLQNRIIVFTIMVMVLFLTTNQLFACDNANASDSSMVERSLVKFTETANHHNKQLSTNQHHFSNTETFHNAVSNDSIHCADLDPTDNCSTMSCECCFVVSENVNRVNLFVVLETKKQFLNAYPSIKDDIIPVPVSPPPIA